LDAQLKRGMIEACILSLLDRGDSYGYQLIKDLSDVMELSESTLYPVLRRLESAQALTTYTNEHSGRLRKYYAITGTGRRMIDDFLTEWADVTKVYDYIRRSKT
jgi:PadR family transcriptional regulator, regulatory protein PadR